MQTFGGIPLIFYDEFDMLRDMLLPRTEPDVL